jgi:hypothetical protein
MFCASKQLALKVVFAIASICGICSSASAQVAKLTSQKCDGYSCTVGSGTCVNIGVRGDRAYFLTAGHCVFGCTKPLIYLHNGAIEARIEAADLNPDLGLLSIPARETSQQPFPLADDVAESTFDFVGFTGGGMYVKRTARLLRRTGGMLVVDMPGGGGDSGGPYLERNRVVGIHCVLANDGRRGNDCVTIRRWLQARVGYVPGSLTTPQPAPSTPQPAPVAATCQCSGEIAALKAQIAELRARCDKPYEPPAVPDTSDITKRLDALEGRIAAVGELTKRIDQLEFKIAEVRLAGGKTEQLEKELAALRDLTFEVRSLAPDGKVVSSEKKRLGENIDLRLVPKRQ